MVATHTQRGRTSMATATARSMGWVVPHWLPEHVDATRGSIPACAGEPWSGIPYRTVGRIYPRVCGGTISPRSWRICLMGLSPRVRGNPHIHPHTGIRLRSIPACAGEPRSEPRPHWPSGVYPRVCGGTVTPSVAVVIVMGLSPRVRGNPPSPCPTGRRSGSIPACAGEPSAGPR